MRTTLKTLRIILSLRTTIEINAIIDGIRHLPIIGKHISEKIHGVRIIKFLAAITSVTGEILRAFFGKLALFACLLLGSGVFSYFNDYSQKTVFLYGFFGLLLIAVFVINYFKTYAETEYAVFIMGMDAKKYVQAIFLYNVFNVVVGYTVFGIPAALLAKVPWYIAFLIPVAGVGIRAITLGIQMSIYAAKQSAGLKAGLKGVPISIGGSLVANVILICALSAAGMVLLPVVVFNDAFLPVSMVVVAAALALIPGILLIRRFPYGLYRTALFAERTRKQINDKNIKKQKRGNTEVAISKTKGIKTNAKGYGFLNELFLKRHRKILWGRLFWTIFATAWAIALASVFLYFELGELEDNTESILRFIFSKHPAVFPMIFFFINSGSSMAHAMYANCDSAFLNFAFYKKPEALKKMFGLRIVSVIKYNVIPAVMIAVFSIVVIALTGGQAYFLQYVFNILTIALALIFFSTRHMVIYYLLQPYAKDVMIKSKLYGITSFITGAVLIIMVFTPLTAWMLTIAGTLITVIYIFAAGKLVYKYSPKTFRIK